MSICKKSKFLLLYSLISLSHLSLSKLTINQKKNSHNHDLNHRFRRSYQPIGQPRSSSQLFGNFGFLSSLFMSMNKDEEKNNDENKNDKGENDNKNGGLTEQEIVDDLNSHNQAFGTNLTIASNNDAINNESFLLINPSSPPPDPRETDTEMSGYDFLETSVSFLDEIVADLGYSKQQLAAINSMSSGEPDDNRQNSAVKIELDDSIEMTGLPILEEITATTGSLIDGEHTTDDAANAASIKENLSALSNTMSLAGSQLSGLSSQIKDATVTKLNSELENAIENFENLQEDSANMANNLQSSVASILNQQIENGIKITDQINQDLESKLQDNNLWFSTENIEERQRQKLEDELRSGSAKAKTFLSELGLVFIAVGFNKIF